MQNLTITGLMVVLISMIAAVFIGCWLFLG